MGKENERRLALVQGSKGLSKRGYKMRKKKNKTLAPGGRINYKPAG
jgi:hypothetical protein